MKAEKFDGQWVIRHGAEAVVLPTEVQHEEDLEVAEDEDGRYLVTSTGLWFIAEDEQGRLVFEPFEEIEVKTAEEFKKEEDRSGNTDFQQNDTYPDESVCSKGAETADILCQSATDIGKDMEDTELKREVTDQRDGKQDLEQRDREEADVTMVDLEYQEGLSEDSQASFIVDRKEPGNMEMKENGGNDQEKPADNLEANTDAAFGEESEERDDNSCTEETDRHVSTVPCAPDQERGYEGRSKLKLERQENQWVIYCNDRKTCLPVQLQDEQELEIAEDEDGRYLVSGSGLWFVAENDDGSLVFEPFEEIEVKTAEEYARKEEGLANGCLDQSCINRDETSSTEEGEEVYIKEPQKKSSSQSSSQSVYSQLTDEELQKEATDQGEMQEENLDEDTIVVAMQPTDANEDRENTEQLEDDWTDTQYDQKTLQFKDDRNLVIQSRATLHEKDDGCSLFGKSSSPNTNKDSTVMIQEQAEAMQGETVLQGNKGTPEETPDSPIEAEDARFHFPESTDALFNTSNVSKGDTNSSQTGRAYCNNTTDAGYHIDPHTSYRDDTGAIIEDEHRRSLADVGYYHGGTYMHECSGENTDASSKGVTNQSTEDAFTGREKSCLGNMESKIGMNVKSYKPAITWNRFERTQTNVQQGSAHFHSSVLMEKTYKGEVQSERNGHSSNASAGSVPLAFVNPIAMDHQYQQNARNHSEGHGGTEHQACVNAPMAISGNRTDTGKDCGLFEEPGGENAFEMTEERTTDKRVFQMDEFWKDLFPKIGFRTALTKYPEVACMEEILPGKFVVTLSGESTEVKKASDVMNSYLKSLHTVKIKLNLPVADTNILLERGILATCQERLAREYTFVMLPDARGKEFVVHVFGGVETARSVRGKLCTMIKHLQVAVVGQYRETLRKERLKEEIAQRYRSKILILDKESFSLVVVGISDCVDEAIQMIKHHMETSRPLEAEKMAAYLDKPIATDGKAGQQERADKLIFEFSRDRKLVLLNLSTEYCDAEIIVNPILEKQEPSMPWIINHQTTIDMKFPRQQNQERLSANIKAFLLRACQDGNTSIAFPVKEFGGWSVIAYTDCLFRTVKQCFASENADLDTMSVLLCTSKAEEYQLMFGVCQSLMDSETIPQEAAGLPGEDIVITLKVGEIHTTEADVLVNSTSRYLKLNKGAVSSALLKAGGDTLQRECDDHYATGIKKGEIAVTGGGRLKCKKVFHGFVDRYAKQFDQASCIQSLRAFMNACLKKATEMCFSSIAFPTIGIGQMGYPAELVAGEMYQNIQRFQIQSPVRTLKEVLIVVYHGDVSAIEVFKKIDATHAKRQNEHQKRWQASNSKQQPITETATDAVATLGPNPVSTGTKPAKAESDRMHAGQRNPQPTSGAARSRNIKYVQQQRGIKDTECKPKVHTIATTKVKGQGTAGTTKSNFNSPGRTKGRTNTQNQPSNPRQAGYHTRQTATNTTTPSLDCVFYESQWRSRRCHILQVGAGHVMKVYTGNVFDVREADAILCSDNAFGTGPGAIVKTLVERGKGAYVSAKKKAFNRKPEPNFCDVIVSAGGQNTFKLVLHSVLPYEGKGDTTWSALYQKALENAFERAVETKVNKLATTLLGAGYGNSDPKKCASVLYDAYVAFCQRCNQNLEVHLVNFEESKTNAVREVFDWQTTNLKESSV